MAITPMQISNQTLESHIQKSFISALNYYKETNIKFKRMREAKTSVYDVSKYLNGDIAPNMYFYSSEYVDDLYLVKEILFKNYNLICLYSYLDIQSVLDYFRQNYQYKNGKKEQVKTFGDLNKIEKPIKGTSRMIENDRDIFSYKNLESNIKLNNEFVTPLILIRETEEKFISSLQYCFQNINQNIPIPGDVFRFYIDFFEEKGISISKFLLTEKNKGSQTYCERFCNYSIMELDIYDNLNVLGDLKNKHAIFKDRNNYSLLVFDEDSKTITHYFSTYNQVLYDYFKKNLPEYKYKIDYEMKTSSICKINEICIVFLIYYNLVNLSNDYNMVYVRDETLRTIIEICYSSLSQNA